MLPLFEWSRRISPPEFASISANITDNRYENSWPNNMCWGELKWLDEHHMCRAKIDHYTWESYLLYIFDISQKQRMFHLLETLWGSIKRYWVNWRGLSLEDNATTFVCGLNMHFTGEQQQEYLEERCEPGSMKRGGTIRNRDRCTIRMHCTMTPQCFTVGHLGSWCSFSIIW